MNSVAWGRDPALWGGPILIITHIGKFLPSEHKCGSQYSYNPKSFLRKLAIDSPARGAQQIASKAD
jgi:hypothetical protein